MRDALDGAPRNICRICDLAIALVDQTINQRSKEARGGKWVHVELPDSPHPATPKGTK